MFPTDKLRYCRINEIPAGHLISVERPEGLAVAIRVEHPTEASDETPFPAAVILHDSARGQRAPITDAGVRNQRCVDWGIRPTVRWKYPTGLLARSRAVGLPDPGYLVLMGQEVAITSSYPGGRGDRLYWNLRTGLATAPGESDFCVIGAWQLGATDADDRFLQLAAYPADYGRPTA